MLRWHFFHIPQETPLSKYESICNENFKVESIEREQRRDI